MPQAINYCCSHPPRRSLTNGRTWFVKLRKLLFSTTFCVTAKFLLLLLLPHLLYFLFISGFVQRIHSFRIVLLLFGISFLLWLSLCYSCGLSHKDLHMQQLWTLICLMASPPLAQQLRHTPGALAPFAYFNWNADCFSFLSSPMHTYSYTFVHSLACNTCHMNLLHALDNSCAGGSKEKFRKNSLMVKWPKKGHICNK